MHSKYSFYVIPDVPIFVADVLNYESLLEMTKQAKVLLNCCGPYSIYGEQVISACVTTATHHVDVSGEPLIAHHTHFCNRCHLMTVFYLLPLSLILFHTLQYMEEVQLAYYDRAKEAGIYIVSACGFDSIPADMGVIFAQKKFGDVVNSIEIYPRFKKTGNPPLGCVNYGTWESLVYCMTH